MYNHYIPQSDGSYRRSSMPERSHKPQFNNPIIPTPKPPPKQQPETEEAPCPPPQQPTQNAPHQQSGNKMQSHPPAPPMPQNDNHGILSFLKGLLPREIDTDDLLIILLIMLMNRDDDCDGLSPMLTLALYFLL